ncbi:hypothetical protein AB0J83_18440 [Actinoplanes sp. NPDC049596]|uniref:hypothetical protein n=1 Tax=unclassified Actinoplanes TaxID=2626549 RepID=UPI00342C4E0D
MSVIGKVLCVAGRHRGQWSYPGRRCESVRVCEVCGRTEERVQHSWGEFAFVVPGGCDRVRRCGRCGATDSWPEHDWGPWRYANWEFNSPQMHTCKRCHATERTSPTYR